MNQIEKRIADYFGRKYCHLTGSGTTAIYLILKALNKKNSYVLYPAITCMTPVNAALYADMKPVFCDVNLKDYTMDLSSLRKMIEEYNIDVIVPTHLYGHSCDMDEILEIAREKDIFVLEDAAQAVGGIYKGRKLGSIGDAAVVSFGHTKILECGGGGAVLTDDEGFYEQVKNLEESIPKQPVNVKELFDDYRRIYYDIMKLIKKDSDFWPLMLSLQMTFKKGFVYAKDAQIENTIGNRLGEIDAMVEERNKRMILYDQYLNKECLNLPDIRDGSVCWRYSFLYKGNRDELLKAVRAQNIDISSWYPTLYQMYGNQPKDQFPNANILEKEIVNLWVDPKYTKEKIIRDIQIINQTLRELE